MKKRIVMVLFVALGCLIFFAGAPVVFGESPWEAPPSLERCEDVRHNSTEYDRCVGDELNKQRADMNKAEELNLDRCKEFLFPYHKLKYEQCVGEEFNKFPEYGPEVMEQYLAGDPWTWPEKDPPWWDDYLPMIEPEQPEEGEFYRWWEDDFYITPQAQDSWDNYYSPGSSDWSSPDW